SRFFEHGLDILADAVQNPSFDADELTRELDVICEEIKRAQDSPGYEASQALFSTAYTCHPYRNPVIGTFESVRSFDQAAVRAFFEKWYVPANMTLVVVGDLDIDETRGLVERSFGSRVPSPAPNKQRPAEPAQAQMRVRLLTSGMREAHLQLAFHVPELVHEDVPALDVLSVLLGGGNSSRLEQIVRREEGLVTSVGTFAYTPRDPGVFSIAATFQPA